MDAYPPEYTSHNFPLVVLSGLQDDADAANAPTGHVIKTESPLVLGAKRDQLLQDFLKAAGNDSDWSGKDLRAQNPLVGFRFKVVGRVCEDIRRRSCQELNIMGIGR